MPPSVPRGRELENAARLKTQDRHKVSDTLLHAPTVELEATRGEAVWSRPLP